MRTATIYNFLLEANIMASLAILLMIPLRKFFRRQLGSPVFCFAWLLVALRLLCPLALPNPVIQEIQSPYAFDPALRPIAGQVQVRLSDATRDLYMWTENNHLQSLTQPTYTLYSGMTNAAIPILLMKIYLIGVAGVILWFVIANLRFRGKLRSGRIEPISGELLEQYTALCRERKVKPIPVYFTDPLPSACLVGVFRPYIALPLTAKPQTVIQVLTHEICHYQARDHLWGILRLLCCAVHWFNPLVWLAAAMSRTDTELRCDDHVTRNQTPEEKQEYASVLVLAAARRNAPGTPILATGMTMTGRKLKNRVLAIVGDRKPIRWLSAAFAGLSVLLLVCAFATRVPAQASDVSPASAAGTVQSRYTAPDLEPPLEGGMQALAFLQSRLTLSAEEIKGLQWRIEQPTHAEDTAQVEWWITGMNAQGGMQVYAFLTSDGMIEGLYENYPAYMAAHEQEGKVPDEVGEAEQRELLSFLLSYIERINPGFSKHIAEWSLVEAWRNEGGRYLEFVAPVEAGYSGDVYAWLYVTENGPQVISLFLDSGNG